MWTSLSILLVGVLIVGGMLVQIARRGLALKQLVADGVDAQARVVARRKFTGGRGQTQYRLTYEYRDPMGQTYRHTSAVSADQWQAHPEGSHFAIAYSRSRPQLSMPRDLVQQGREALRGR